MPARGIVPRVEDPGSCGKLAAALVYRLKHAPFAVQVINEHVKRGEPIPTPFDKPPGASVFHQIYVTAFDELSAERDLGKEPTDVLRITRRQIIGWLESYDFEDDREFREELLIVIPAMDNEFIPIERKRRETAQRKASKGKGRRRGAKS